jgi:hypothetical protein
MMSSGPRALSAALLSFACTCVAADTPVQTPDGDVAIGQLTVGDIVWSIDVRDGRRIAATVVAVRRAVRECVALRWHDGELICTSDHPLFDPDRGDYRPAGDWVTGAARRLLRRHEHLHPVDVLAARTYAGTREVVDITLSAEPHNFVAAGVVVHNKSYAGPEIEGELLAVADLTAAEREQTFRVHACHGGREPYGLRLHVHLGAEPIPATEDDGSLRFSAIVEGRDGHAEFRDGPAPAWFDFYADPPDDACARGFRVIFGRLDDRADADVHIQWRLEASAYVYELEDEDDELELSVELEP